ncbi:MAG TPA: DUF1614 domain-containing protein [Dehalococcoidia bacterium]|nr:DUF1614 domain-containing protein [Dehalococcoidia bacterium]
MHVPFVIALIAIGLGVLLIVVAFDLLTISFEHLGISPWATFLIFVASAIGSLINIPIWASHPEFQPGGFFRIREHIYYVHPHMANNQIVAINVGGAVIPILLSLWLLPRAPLLRTLAATAIVAVIAHISATIVPGRGITMPLLLGPIVAAVAALLLTGGRRAAPVAYIAGAMGILIGADLSNLGRMSEIGSGVLSIGGAGVFDGVFLTGLIAALLSFDTSSKKAPPVEMHG